MKCTKPKKIIQKTNPPNRFIWCKNLLGKATKSLLFLFGKFIGVLVLDVLLENRLDWGIRLVYLCMRSGSGVMGSQIE